jgi:glutathionyl-hydroquinone reductase
MGMLANGIWHDEDSQRLGRQRYLVDDRFTEADLRLFPTLVRFDAVYYSQFRYNLRRLADTELDFSAPHGREGMVNAA